MNQLKYLCQMRLWPLAFVLIFFFGCTRQSVDDDPRKQSQLVVSQWFEGPRRMAPLDRHRQVPIHYFFDPSPAPQFDRNELSYVQKTPRNSRYSYDIDMVSGKLYRRFDYCPQNDVWERGKTIRRPPMHIGVIPRLIDQLGMPQSVLVFGRHQTDGNFKANDPPIHRTRIIGGVIEQYCEKTICTTPSEWLSRMVLIGVVPYDERFAGVNSLAALTDVIDWESAVAFMENRKGRSSPGSYDRPSYRIFGEIEGRQAMREAFRRGHYFRFSQMQSLQRGCHHLYDYTWDKLRQFYIESYRARDKTPPAVLDESGDATNQLDGLDSDFLADDSIISGGQGNIFTRTFQATRLLEEGGEKERRQKGRGPSPEQITQWLESDDFRDFFRGYVLRHGRSYRTCMRYVRPSNFKMNSRRHWTMAYLSAYFAMERLGYVYHCPSRTWIENITFADGTRRFDPERVILQCTGSQIDQAFPAALTILTGIRNSQAPHFHYIRYDMGTGGSHEEIFSWVKSTGKSLACRRDESRVPIADFPDDVGWTPLSPLRDSQRIEVIR